MRQLRYVLRAWRRRTSLLHLALRRAGLKGSDGRNSRCAVLLAGALLVIIGFNMRHSNPAKDMTAEREKLKADIARTERLSTAVEAIKPMPAIPVAVAQPTPHSVEPMTPAVPAAVVQPSPSMVVEQPALPDCQSASIYLINNFVNWDITSLIHLSYGLR